MAYGGGLENRFRLFGERGFESHPLRHLGDGSLMMREAVIITFLVSTRSSARESKLANESLSSG